MKLSGLFDLQVIANTQTASYTPVLGDAYKLVEMNVATANNFTIPPNSSVAFKIGTIIDIVQYGAGQTTIVAGVGVTLRAPGAALKVAEQYSIITIIKRGTNEWYVTGNLTV